MVIVLDQIWLPFWLEALELDQPTLVTLSLLEDLINETDSQVSAAHAARLLRERGWLLPLRKSGIWEFAPGARAGAWGGGDPFVELRARLATRPIETAVAAESAAWLLALSTRAPEPHAIALPPGVNLPKSLDGFRVVRWAALDQLGDSDGLPLWLPEKYRDWPNVSEWLTECVARVSVQALRDELAEVRIVRTRFGFLADFDRLLSSAELPSEFCSRQPCCPGTGTPDIEVVSPFLLLGGPDRRQGIEP